MKQNLANETIKTAIKDMVKELNLKQYPKVVTETVNEDYVMAASGTVTYQTRDWFRKIIIKTECDYTLRINKKAVNNMILAYYIAFGNKQASYDCLYLLVCHELRHMWQYQEQFQVGDEYGSLSETLNETANGHGANKVEEDANKWMMSIAKRHNLEELASYMELTQRAMGLFNRNSVEFYKTMKDKRLNTLKKYNRIMYWLFS